jgi:peptide-methionine (S)-S-oxide reductase
LIALLLAIVVTAPPPPAERAVFAGGCYWGVEAVFEHVRGVTSAVSGFSDGIESVEVTFDPAAVSYQQLLEVFFAIAHDPTSRDRQGPDAGREYRAVVFHRDEMQRRQAAGFIARLDQERRFARPIVTEVRPLPGFRPAPSSEQDYLARHRDAPYIVINDLPKLERLRVQFPALYRDR